MCCARPACRSPPLEPYRHVVLDIIPRPMPVRRFPGAPRRSRLVGAEGGLTSAGPATRGPFATDAPGSTISATEDASSSGWVLGRAAMPGVPSSIEPPAHHALAGCSAAHPFEEHTAALRRYFQYFATAALAAETGGPAWLFGFARLDGSGFLKKLFGDPAGAESTARFPRVRPQGAAAPVAARDDQVDVFAWRTQGDGLPGFLLAAAQVATGRDWRDQSIRSPVKSVFPGRWFSPIPVTPMTEMVAYPVMPFARPDDQFRDDVPVLGNVLHRIRVPKRVGESQYRLPACRSKHLSNSRKRRIGSTHTFKKASRSVRHRCHSICLLPRGGPGGASGGLRLRRIVKAAAAGLLQCRRAATTGRPATVGRKHW